MPRRRRQEQKSKDMHDMALAAARAGRKATCKSYLAQKNTHDNAVAQYAGVPPPQCQTRAVMLTRPRAGLISTLVQQQTVQDISAVHREIAGALKNQKEADYSTQIDNAADWAESVERHQHEFGAIGGAMFQTGDDDVDAQVAAMMAELAVESGGATEAAATTQAPAEAMPAAAHRREPAVELPSVPAEPPSTQPIDQAALPPVFSALLEQRAAGEAQPSPTPAARPPEPRAGSTAQFTFRL